MVIEPLVDCQDALRAYTELWSGPRRVLSLEGMSGVGKSTLLRYLIGHHETARPRVLVDLAEIPLTRADVVAALTDQFAAAGAGRGPVTVTIQGRWFGRVVGSPVTVAGVGEPDLSGLDFLGPSEWLLLVDHCDELDGDPPMRRWFEGRLLPHLLGRFSGLRVVLAAEHGPRGPAYERLSHRLRTWTAAESAGFLAYRGLVDEAAARAIHDAFDGLGLLVSLARETLEEATRAGRVFDVADVAGERIDAWLFGRLVATLPAAIGDAARSALRLRRFTADLLGCVGLTRQLPDVDYRALTTRSWVRRVPGGGHEVDPRVRFAYAAWCRAERPEEFVAFHVRASRVFNDRSARLDFVYHLLSVDPDAGIAVWADAFDRANAPDRAALARVIRLPEIWAWLPRQGRMAWSARAGTLAGSAPATGLRLVAHQHTQSVNQTQKTETTPAVTAADRRGAEGRGGV